MLRWLRKWLKEEPEEDHYRSFTLGVKYPDKPPVRITWPREKKSEKP